MQHRPFVIEAAVILPDHIHCLWRLPIDDYDFSSRWREIKKAVTKRMGNERNVRKEGTIWQRRFWEHLVRDECDWRNPMDYIHYNPVKHGYVAKPSQRQWSIFNRYVGRGVYDLEWGGTEPENVSGFYFE